MAIEKAVARSKSYVSASIIIFFLYGLLWLPGLIANWMYLQDAHKMERLAGEPLPGVGCLTIMFWSNVMLTVLAIIAGCVVLALSVAGGG